MGIDWKPWNMPQWSRNSKDEMLISFILAICRNLHKVSRKLSVKKTLNRFLFFHKHKVGFTQFYMNNLKGSLGHKVSLFLNILWNRNSVLFSIMTISIYILANNTLGPCFLHLHSILFSDLFITVILIAMMWYLRMVFGLYLLGDQL